MLPASGSCTRLAVLPSPRAIVSWNGTVAANTLELTVHLRDGRRSRALPYAVFEPGGRASLDGFDDCARIATDVVHGEADIVAVDVHAGATLERVAASTPPAEAPRDAAPAALARRELDVPEHAQYIAAFPAERGWCAPAAIAMLLGAWDVPASVEDVAAGLYDRAYGGTGNWAFAVAYAGARGFAAAAAYLRDVVSLESFVGAGLPLAVSIAWADGELPGAPLPHSAGHLVVVRGFDAAGDPIVNDPAQPRVRHVYPRAAFARCWLGHGGVALLIAPPGRVPELLRCANA
jgi:hypothetical protein